MPQPQTAPAQQPIRHLPAHLANQIAAGEVVERPASIVKELIENSLDAGARRITVILKQGGLQYICVQDDGLGIPAEELHLALAPHATSKISRLEDLAAIISMGFRGEALASIASVAHVQITSRNHDDERGWTVQGPAAEDKPVPAAHPQGTTVTVQELFFNTPARRRFLRSERTEYRHCEDVVRRMALSRFDVSFVLKHNQRTVFSLPAAAVDAAAQKQRVLRLCGRAFIQQAMALEFLHGAMQLHGWLGLPEAARPQSDLQYFFVNGRIIRDRVISHALRQAFADRLYPGRHPAYVLYLTLDPTEVDVNVHPTKHEVRFHHGRLVHDFLVRCVDETLHLQGENRSLPYARQGLDWHVSATGNAPEFSEPGPATVPPRVAEAASRYPVASASDVNRLFGSLLTVLHDRYALFEHPSGLRIIDVPRLYRDYLAHQFQEMLVEGRIPQRPLLIPQHLTVAIDTACLEEHHELIEKIGFDLGVTGKHSVILRRGPVLLDRIDITQFIPVWLGELTRHTALTLDEVVADLLRLAADFVSTSWQESELSPLLNWLMNSKEPMVHPAVGVLDKRMLDTLFRS
jgi:DNA mismatch repair protein MutL